MTFWTLIFFQSRRTSWHHDLLFEVMTYFCMSWHNFYHHDVFHILFDIMLHILTSWHNVWTLWHAFWRHSIPFWYHDILYFHTLWQTFWCHDVLYNIFLTSLCTFNIFRLCHDILKDKAEIRKIILYFYHAFGKNVCPILMRVLWDYAFSVCLWISHPWRSWPLRPMIKCIDGTLYCDK